MKYVIVLILGMIVGMLLNWPSNAEMAARYRAAANAYATPVPTYLAPITTPTVVWK